MQSNDVIDDMEIEEFEDCVSTNQKDILDTNAKSNIFPNVEPSSPSKSSQKHHFQHPKHQHIKNLESEENNLTVIPMQTYNHNNSYSNENNEPNAQKSVQFMKDVLDGLRNNGIVILTLPNSKDGLKKTVSSLYDELCHPDITSPECNQCTKVDNKYNAEESDRDDIRQATAVNSMEHQDLKKKNSKTMNTNNTNSNSKWKQVQSHQEKLVQMNSTGCDSNLNNKNENENTLNDLSKRQSRLREAVNKPETFVEAARRRTSVATIVLTKHLKSQELKKSGFGKFLDGDGLRIEDLDQGVNAMALLNALILTIPYQLLGSVGSDYFDWLLIEINKCDGNVTSRGHGFETIKLFYREELLCCIYASVCGLILSTFYFLFKRTTAEQLLLWKHKARMLVIALFICTTFSLLALMALSNIFITWYFIGTDMLCNLNLDIYTGPAMFFAALTFFLACYLVY